MHPQLGSSPKGNVVLMPAVCLSWLEDQDFGSQREMMTFVLGETEKPVVSCYALGEWRVSPDYFATFLQPFM